MNTLLTACAVCSHERDDLAPCAGLGADALRRVLQPQAPALPGTPTRAQVPHCKRRGGWFCAAFLPCLPACLGYGFSHQDASCCKVGMVWQAKSQPHHTLLPSEMAAVCNGALPAAQPCRDAAHARSGADGSKRTILLQPASGLCLAIMNLVWLCTPLAHLAQWASLPSSLHMNPGQAIIQTLFL